MGHKSIYTRGPIIKRPPKFSRLQGVTLCARGVFGPQFHMEPLAPNLFFGSESPFQRWTPAFWGSMLTQGSLDFRNSKVDQSVGNPIQAKKTKGKPKKKKQLLEVFLGTLLRNPVICGGFRSLRRRKSQRRRRRRLALRRRPLRSARTGGRLDTCGRRSLEPYLKRSIRYGCVVFGCLFWGTPRTTQNQAPFSRPGENPQKPSLLLSRFSGLSHQAYFPLASESRAPLSPAGCHGRSMRNRATINDKLHGSQASLCS